MSASNLSLVKFAAANRYNLALARSIATQSAPEVVNALDFRDTRVKTTSEAPSGGERMGCETGCQPFQFQGSGPVEEVTNGVPDSGRGSALPIEADTRGREDKCDEQPRKGIVLAEGGIPEGPRLSKVHFERGGNPAEVRGIGVVGSVAEVAGGFGLTRHRRVRSTGDQAVAA